MVVNWVQRRGSDRDVERRARQIKEIVRLGTELRAEMGLESILARVVDAISGTLGFQVAVLNLFPSGAEYAEVVATSGLTDAERQRLIKSPPPVARLFSVMRPEFCVGRSYFISHLYKHLLEGVEGVTVYTPQPPSAQRSPDAWHPEDALFVPLYSPRHEGDILGILSLDQPDDGKIPSLETLEIVELFASQAALAIDTSALFQEREQERGALEDQLFALLYHLEQVRQGNLEVRVQADDQALRPMAESLNAVLEALSKLLRETRQAGVVVAENAGDMRDAVTQLVTNAQYQADQILEVSTAIGDMAASVHTIADIAHRAAGEAREAIEISQEGRDAAEHAAEGMSQVREMAIQSVKKMKRLGESSQEIGEIVQMVSDFTSQTNLLALNAAIEAARAGENGRGFAIVAQEIRNLANGSAEATKQIHARIKGVQNETNSVVIAIEHSTQQVVLQSELALRAGAALEAVDIATQKLARAIAVINDTATQQAETAAAISRSMSGIADITVQTRDSMEESRAALDRLEELARALLRSISVFRLGAAPEREAEPPASALSPAATPEIVTQPMPAVSIPGSAASIPLYAPPHVVAPSPVARGATTRALPQSPAPLPPLPPLPQSVGAPPPADPGRPPASADMAFPGAPDSNPPSPPRSLPSISGPLGADRYDAAPPIPVRARYENGAVPSLEHDERDEQG